MIVADGRTHLAGREVENLPAGRVPYVASTRLLDDFAIDVATVTDQMLAEIRSDGYRVLTGRTSLTPLRKLWLAWRTPL